MQNVAEMNETDYVSDMSCEFLVLQPVDNVTGEPLLGQIGKILNINSFDKVQSFKPTKNYLFQTFQFESIHEAVKALAKMENMFPVLGTYSPDVIEYLNQPDVCLPRWKLSKDDRSITTICEGVDNRGILELDNVLIDDFNSASPVDAIRSWLRIRGINCDVTYQLSASQRINSNEAKLHIFFEYEQCYPLASRKVHSVSLGGDGSVFNGVNPLYVSPPVFVDDNNQVVPDPLPNRIGFISGSFRKLKHMPDIKKMERYLVPRGYAVKGNFIDKIVLSFNHPDNAKKAIESGRVFHDAHVYLSMHYANNRLSASDIESLIMLLMNNVSHQDERWRVRCEELPGICQSAVSLFQSQIKNGQNVNRVVSEYVASGSDIYTNVDWPPGFCGRLAREIWEMMHFPNKQIAIIAAHVCVVNFSGRKSSFRSIDMSRSYELLARTGVGKDTPRWAMELLIDTLSRRYNFLENLHLFYPLGRSFGTSALLRNCRTQLSVMIINSEGGISNKSNSGDQSTVKSFIMQNQSSSSYERLTMPDYSKQMPSVYGVSLTILYESTKESHVMKSEIFETGEAGRLNKFHCSHFVDDIQRNKRDKFSDQIIEGVKNLYLEAVRGEDFNYEVTIGKDVYTGASLTRVNSKDRVYFQCTKDVGNRFNQINEREIARRNAAISEDSEREWAEKSRYEFRVMKECLIIAYADAGSTAKNTAASAMARDDQSQMQTDEPQDFELESRGVNSGSENQALHSQKQMQNMALVTKDHMDYAEAYIQELDRADKANSHDYDPDDVVLVALVEEFCHRIFNKSLDELPKLYVKKMGGSKKAEEFFKRKIVFKSMLMANGNSRMMKQVSKMCASSSQRDAHRVIENAFRSGESEGRWVFMKATHSDNIYKVDYVQIGEG